jgi:hypothetical protein
MTLRKHGVKLRKRKRSVPILVHLSNGLFRPLRISHPRASLKFDCGDLAILIRIQAGKCLLRRDSKGLVNASSPKA